jgi:putative FmdB family regulatory protein
MPLYEYKCSACGHRFERIVKFSDAPLKTCPQCGTETVEQVISAPAVQFKGSGWYVSDYARKSSGAASSKASDGGGEVSASKESGTAKESSPPASGSPEKTPGSAAAPAGGKSAKSGDSAGKNK